MTENNERWTIGGTELTCVVEAETHGIPASLFFPDVAADDVAAASEWLPAGAAAADGSIAFRVQSFVLKHRGLTVLIDPCVGNHKDLTMPFWNDLALPWLDDFRAAGFDPAAVDIVIHTHLHEDHIGWDTHLVDGVWVPTFPNARHVYVDAEIEWAETEERRQGQDPFAQSIAPIVDAGLADVVAPDADLGNGLQLLSTPGHTPGHVSLSVDTGAERLVVSGDLLHHQFQLARPAVAEVADIDVAGAVRTRTDFFAEMATAGHVVAGTHFPIAPVGHIEAHRNAWRWTPVSGTPIS